MHYIYSIQHEREKDHRLLLYLAATNLNKAGQVFYLTQRSDAENNSNTVSTE